MSSMTTDVPDSLNLDLEDVQTIVLRPGGYPAARYTFLHIPDAAAGRACLKKLVSLITDAQLTAEGERPDLAINVGFTWKGLKALGVPWRSLASFPAEFQQGMRARAEYLHDVGESAPKHWDTIWAGEPEVHAWVGVFSKKRSDTNRRDGESVATAYLQQVEDELAMMRGILDDHGIEILGQQTVGMLKVNGQPSHLEHFGYRDGLSKEYIQGAGEKKLEFKDEAGGARDEGKWRGLAPGEAVLGHPNEDGELGHLPFPMGLARNGSYLVYRKLEQKVWTFRDWLEKEGARFPGGKELLAAKLVGRWRNGAPLVEFPTESDLPDLPARLADLSEAERRRITNFTYEEHDKDGARCPLGSHTRRMNPRDSDGFDGKLVNRHRILRRGLPYGDWIPEGQERKKHDEGRGIVFMVINTSIEQQFEFVQREWVNYGNDFRQGNDPDPLIGHHPDGPDELGTKMVIQGDPLPESKNGKKKKKPPEPASPGKVPWICAELPGFVRTKGGDYFFVPSITALHLIAEGKIETS